MTNSSFLDFYKNTRLPEKDQEKLQSSFLGFSDIFGVSLQLIRNNLVTGWVFPVLWSLLIQVLLSAVTLSLVAVVAFDSDFARTFSQYNYEDSFPPAQTVIWFVSSTTLALIIPSIVAAVASYWLQLKQYALLNNKSVNGVWKMNDNMFSELGKAILAQIIISLSYLPFVILSVGFFVFGSGSIGRFIIDQTNITGVSGEAYSFFLNFDSNLGLGVLFTFLGFVIIGLSAFIPAFLGLFQQLIIHENMSAWQAITTSYYLSIQKFWANILRWLVFVLVLMAISAGFSLIDSLFSFIFQAIVMVGSNPNSTDINMQSSIFLGIGALISFIFQLALQIILWVFFTAFSYTAFYNFRHTVLEKK